jgi:hypothetical protein
MIASSVTTPSTRVASVRLTTGSTPPLSVAGSSRVRGGIVDRSQHAHRVPRVGVARIQLARARELLERMRRGNRSERNMVLTDGSIGPIACH